MTHNRMPALIMMLCAAALLIGCDDDDPATPATTGSLAIDVEPAGVGAMWTLEGPDAVIVTSAGDTVLTDLAPGDYTLDWGTAPGWITPQPNPAALTVTRGATATAAGVYTVDTFAYTRDAMLANMVAAYENLDFAAYRELLHPDFLMLLQQETAELFPDLGPTIDHAQELRIHERMFSGEPLTDPDGFLVPGVSGIDVLLFQRQDEWTTSNNPDIPDSGDPEHPVVRALFDAIILVDRGPTFSYLRSEGQLEFYVASRDSLHNGSIHPYYTIRGLRDLTIATKASEGTTWGTVKALFR
jgi:hypothetical protein